MRWLLPLIVATALCRNSAGADSPPGVIFVVDGIGGLRALGHVTRLTLPSAGVKHELREFRWTHGTFSMIRDLQDRAQLLQRADELAAEIRKVRADDPDRPIYVIGHSAGTAIVLAAVEQLPPASLERIILLSAAVSPSFDLRTALRVTRREVVAYSSSLDWFILNWGTRQFGAADGFYGPSAGYSGFRVPEHLDGEGRELYRRLVQKPWKPEEVFAGRGGGHHSTVSPLFVARHLAPWLKP